MHLNLICKTSVQNWSKKETENKHKKAPSMSILVIAAIADQKAFWVMQIIESSATFQGQNTLSPLNLQHSKL